MAIDLMALEPNKVSRDLSGYVTYLYGAAKAGKTTLAAHSPGALILAFETGYRALPGVYAQNIGSWSDVKSVVRELKKPEVRERFKTIIWDTIDIAGELCEKYVCAQNDIESINKLPYGQGWTLMKKEFGGIIRAMTQAGYAVFFISHDKSMEIVTKTGEKYNQIVPTCPNTFNNLAKNEADIYAYADKYTEDGEAKVRLVLRSPDNSIETGCRFKYIKPVVDMSYDALVEALNEAIEAEAAENGGQYVTDKRAEVFTKEYDFEGLINEFNAMAEELLTRDEAYYKPRISLIIERIFGRGKRLADADLSQVELVSQAVEETRELYEAARN